MPILSHRVLLSLALAATGCATTAPVERAGTELPVSRVILYQNGVGYFERTGEISGAEVVLPVRPGQMNDLLKSLTVIDERGGKAVSVSMPLEKQAADALAELPEQVRDAGGLREILTVFRGATVVVKGGEGTVRGRIVGIEGVHGEEGGEGTRLTLKVADGLRVYPVEAIERLVLLDGTLNVGFDKSLDVSLNQASWRPLPVTVHLSEGGTHRLRVSYITEMPLWKPTYRLVLGDQGQGLLQGWAVVDNVSGEDWNSVALSLVAGAPISFIYDLHRPRFMRRVDLTPPDSATALAPTMDAPAYGAPPPAPAPSAKKSMARMREDHAPTMESGAMKQETMMLMDALEEQAAPSATGTAVGALFRYDLPDPITVPDRGSALVALVSRRMPVEDVVLFRSEEFSGAQGGVPYRAVYVRNDTGLTLETGPVAIYGQETFLGESFLQRAAADAQIFLTYAKDERVSLSIERANRQEAARLLKIVAGALHTEVLNVQRSQLTVRNRRDAATKVFVKVPKMLGWSLRDAPAGMVSTEDAHYLPVQVQGHEEAPVAIEWTQPVRRTLTIDTDLGAAALKAFFEGGAVPKGLEKPLREVLQLRAEIFENEAESKRVAGQRAALTQEVERVRENLNLLRRTRGNQELQSQAVKRLGELEQTLGGYAGELVRLSEEKANLERRMRQLMQDITLDPS